jgi:hypothetical protein
MACRGGFLALSAPQVNFLLSLKDDDAVIDYLDPLILDYYRQSSPYLQQTDKAWDAMHRCLSGGTLEAKSGAYPLNRTVLGGHQLYRGRGYIVSFVSAEEVPDVARALQSVTDEWMRERYFRLTEYDGDLTEEDFEYTWSWFQGTQSFYQRAAQEGLAVVFSVDL